MGHLESVPDISDGVCAEMDAESRRSAVRRALSVLPDIERQIIELRFGFGDRPLTLAEIGLSLGLSRDQVREREGWGLARMAAMRILAEETGVLHEHPVGSVG